MRANGKEDITMWHVLVGMLLGIAATGLLMMCSGCTTTEYVTVEKVRTDTLWKTHTQLDSIYIERHDSIVTYQKGDTVTVDRWHYRDRWRDRVKTDTIYKSKTDTVKVAVAQQKTKPLTWWQQARIYLADVLLWALAIGVVIYIGKKHIGMLTNIHRL